MLNNEGGKGLLRLAETCKGLQRIFTVCEGLLKVGEG